MNSLYSDIFLQAGGLAEKKKTAPKVKAKVNVPVIVTYQRMQN